MRFAFGEVPDWRDLSLRIRDLKHEIEVFERQTKQDHIAAWRHSLVQSDSALARWIRRKCTPVALPLLDQSA